MQTQTLEHQVSHGGQQEFTVARQSPRDFRAYILLNDVVESVLDIYHV